MRHPLVGLLLFAGSIRKARQLVNRNRRKEAEERALNNGHFCHFDFFFVISTSSLSFRPKGEIHVPNAMRDL